MNRENDIVRELEELGSTLGRLDRRMPYAVPTGYFEGLAHDVQATMGAMEQPEAAPAWGKAMPFGTPTGYFDGLAANIMAKAKDEDELKTLPRTMPMGVPAGYFDALPALILAAAKGQDVAKKKTVVVSLKKTYAIRPVRWAAAAIMLICISVGGYVFFSPQQSEPEQMLSLVPANDIHDYLQGTYRIDMDRVMNNDNISTLQLDNTEIVAYLNETGWDVAE